MAGEGLQWEPIHLPLAAGLNTKAHPHALEPPGLTTCKNVEFDEVGGLRLRKPYSTGVFTNDIYPSGTISNPRRLAVDGDEILLFTKDTLYSWSENLLKWVNKGTHLAAKVSEATRFGNTSDQVFADRAVLGSLTAQVWTEVTMGGTVRSWLAAWDTNTGATLIEPTNFGANVVRPRLTAIDTKIVVTWLLTGTGIRCKVIDPSAPAFTSAGSTAVTAFQGAYDVVRDPANDRAVLAVRNAGGTEFVVAKITGAPAVTLASFLRTCDGVIALSVAPTGQDRVHVLRTDATQIRGDLIVLSTLSDVTSNTLVGTAAATVNQLTCAHRTVADGGFYRCYTFWSAGESTGSAGFALESNWIDTNSAIGTEATFLLKQGIAARAFDHGGRVFLWSVFAGESQAAGMGVPLGIRAQLQSSYFLHRDDAFQVGKACWGKAGGFGYTSGHLPGCVLGPSGYTFAGIEKEIIITGGTDHTSYGARTPHEVSIEFDSDEARRTVKLGRTLYVSGAEILQYDGEGLVEVGFPQYPWFFGAATIGGAIPAGTYSYKSTLSWRNARGETERSTTATGEQVSPGAAFQTAFTASNLHITRKQGSRRAAAFEIWRTKIAPQHDSPFYLVTSKDPASTGVNSFVANDPATNFATFGNDNMTDAVLETKEQNPENGAVLPRQAPPPATIMAASESRLFLAGVAGEPSRVWYSYLRGEGEIVGFASTLSFSIPSWAGPITALSFINETLIVFTSSTCWAVPGDGFDNTGGGTNYGPPRRLSADVGAYGGDHGAIVATTPAGIVFFSRKGWYQLGTSWELQYIGAKIESFNTHEFITAKVVETQHQIRILSETTMLVWDYLVGEWSEWTQTNGLDLAITDGSSLLLDTSGAKSEDSVSEASYNMEIETGWIKLGGLQGFGRVREIEVLGEFKADHQQRIRLARDYKTTYFDDRTITVDLTTASPAQVRHGPSQQRCQAMRVRITILGSAGATLDYDAVTLTGLSLLVGLKPGLYKSLPVAQRQ